MQSQVNKVDGLFAPRRDLPESKMSRHDVVQKEQAACLSKFRPPSRNMYVESTALSCISPTQICGSHPAFNKEVSNIFLILGFCERNSLGLGDYFVSRSHCSTEYSLAVMMRPTKRGLV